uniref:Plexin b2a, tandem duplicate 1 n=1 Tax=Lepisosteus oculatus TaxID=7918 RepID=W5NEH5_LEPOC
MGCWTGALCLLLSFCLGCAVAEPNEHFATEKEIINNVVQDPHTGRVYLGAVNGIYQLNSDLRKEKYRETGPKDDNPSCIPPITRACDAKPTNNTNKLLLVHESNSSLIVCGSLFRGICSLLNLSNIEDVIYYSEDKGERAFVVSADETVSVVGVMSTLMKEEENLTVFLVGKSYDGSHDNSKLISTRILKNYRDWVVFENLVEAPVQTSSYGLKYKHDFRYAFKDEGFAYFLFSRTNGKSDKNYTFISRLCENDSHYYSYTELQLNCSEAGTALNQYSKVQAAYITSPGEQLASIMSQSSRNGHVTAQDKVLFVVMSTDLESKQQSSALCMYPLKAINARLAQIISSCYSELGDIKGEQAVYTPYSETLHCTSVNKVQVDQYPCGADFLPSPLAGMPAFAVSSEAVFHSKDQLTAVAVSVENGHSIAFLGTSAGMICKVHLANVSKRYENITVGNTRVNKNLFFAKSWKHIYVTTEKKITRLPVQQCHQRKSCQACVAPKDPYCGWCVMEGRCTRKAECSRAQEANHWIWSPSGTCVQITGFDPPNLSRRKTGNVRLTLSPLPAIKDSDELKCSFGVSDSVARYENDQIVCSLPEPSLIPPTPGNQDFVALNVTLISVNGSVQIAARKYKFYDCSAAMKKDPNTPCMSCVTSSWNCQWNTETHTCSESDDTSADMNIIRNTQAKGEKCPQFETPHPQQIPVGHKTPITFVGRNLDIEQGKKFKIGTELMEGEEDVTSTGGSSFRFPGFKFSYDKGQTVDLLFYVREDGTNHRIDSTLNVTLYNCSFGREDCSLCKSADPQYNCVWCGTTSSCIYKQLCSDEIQECPVPQITGIIPRYGPLEGGIAVTIKGSNLGIRKEDIRSITVAGVECKHEPERYSVSTSVICEIGPVPRSLSGTVVVEVGDGKTGSSKETFTYRDPVPTAVSPNKGPMAGGTVITISGEYLDTATKEDLKITVGDVECTEVQLAEEIQCKTGPYSGNMLSVPLDVTVNYGGKTSKTVGKAFQFLENPKVVDYNPGESFMCGGRNISVFGRGFDLVQQAVMRVVPSSMKNTDSDSNNQTFHEPAHWKNDTVIEFRSPAVSNKYENDDLNTFIILDNLEVDLKDIKTDAKFEYHSDPTFQNLTKTTISDNSAISVKGKGFKKAMTKKEVEAFVGDKACKVTSLEDDMIYLNPPTERPTAQFRRPKRDTSSNLDLLIKFGNGEWVVGKVSYETKDQVPLHIIIPVVIIPMLAIIAVSIYCYRRKSQEAEREYEKVKHQLESLEESVRDRCKKEFTDLMIEMEDHTSELNEARIPFLDYKTYTDRVFFLPSKDGANDVMITGKLDIPEARRATVEQALNQFSNLLNSKPFLINFIRTLEGRPDFNARARGYFASLLTVALHGKLEYYTDIMRTLLLELMEQYVHSKNPKLMLRRSETVVERMLCNWMSICLYQFLKDSVGEPLYKLFKAIKHQVEKGPVDAVMKKAKYTLNDTGLLGDDVEYATLTLQVLVHGEGPDVTLVKVLNCDTISQVKEKIIDQVYRNLPYSQRPKVDSVALEWRPGSTGQILSDLDLTSQKEGRWKRMNTLAHYNVRDNAILVLSRVLHPQQPDEQHQDNHEERNALLEDDKVFHLVRPADELDDAKSKRGSMKDKAMTKAITEIYLTRLLSVKGTLQQFVDDFFRSVLCSGTVVPPAVKYFFDFLDEQAEKHENVDEETIHIWKTNSLPMHFPVINALYRTEEYEKSDQLIKIIEISLSITNSVQYENKCSERLYSFVTDSPSNKLLYAKEISTYKKMVDDYYKGIRQMVPVSDQDMNTHLAEVSRAHTDQLNTQVALHQLYQYASKYYDGIINSLDEDPATQNKQLTLRLQQIAAALENKVTDL